MAVDEKTVAHVAELARIALAPGDVPTLTGELNRIFNWVDQLEQVETGDAQPMISPFDEARVWREDAITAPSHRDELMANAPEPAHGFFTVPKVVE